jgi:hypothetical protein
MRHRQRHGVARFLGLGVCLLVASATASGQQQIRFYLAATSGAGEPVMDLKPAEISVLENDMPGSVVSVVPVTRPVKITVLVDNGPNTSTLLTQYRNGLKAFFGALPPGIESSLLTLAPQPRWVVRPTGDRDLLVKGVDRMLPDDSPPRFIDGLIEAANRIEQENRRQLAYFPVIVVLSTTGLEGSGVVGRSVDRMATQLLTYAARLHVIMLGTNARSPSILLGAAQVQIGKTLADRTGGRYEAIAAPTRIASLLPEYGQLIAAAHAFQRQQYLVTASRPAGLTGPSGVLAVVPVRPGVTFTATAQGLKP